MQFLFYFLWWGYDGGGESGLIVQTNQSLTFLCIERFAIETIGLCSNHISILCPRIESALDYKWSIDEIYKSKSCDIWRGKTKKLLFVFGLM